MGGVFIACRLTDKIRDDPQNPCPKKWDQPDLTAGEATQDLEPLILELNLTRFSTFVPGPRDTRNDRFLTHFLANFWATFWAILSDDYGKKGAKMENRGPEMGSRNWPKMTQKWVILGKSIHGRVQGISRTKPVLSPRARGILKMTHFGVP